MKFSLFHLGVVLSAVATANGLLDECEFDCDSDADCEPGLWCAEDHQAYLESVGWDERKANCGPVGPWNQEVCFDPLVIQSLLGECQADCDVNDDCMDGLLCAEEVTPLSSDKRKAYCGNVGGSTDEVCYDPCKDFYLSQSDQQLYFLVNPPYENTNTPKIGQYCYVYDAEGEGGACLLYAKGRPRYDENENLIADGVPPNENRGGTGCVFDVDNHSDCFWDNPEVVDLTQDEIDGMCTDDVVANAANQIRWAIENDYCMEEGEPLTCDCSHPSCCPDGPELYLWNGAGAPQLQYENNCYNYATNQKTNTWSITGVASGLYGPDDWDQFTRNCVEVATRAIADGLTSLGPFSQDCPPNFCLVALYVHQEFGYHWYRKNKSGSWSHKMSGNPATTKDQSGVEIGTSLVGIDTGLWEFCEYMCTPCELQIARRLVEPPAVSNAAFFDIQIIARPGEYNPGWNPDAAEIDFIQSALESIEGKGEGEEPWWPIKFGYAGFVVFLEGKVIRVWQFTIEVVEGDRTTYYYDSLEDPDYVNLEDYLIERATERGFGDEVPQPSDEGRQRL